MNPIIFYNFFPKFFFSPGTTQGKFLVPWQIGENKQTNKKTQKSYQISAHGNQVQPSFFLCSDLLRTSFCHFLRLSDITGDQLVTAHKVQPFIYLSWKAKTNLISASLFKIPIFINACDILEKIWLLDFNSLQHSAFPLSPGPEVHLGPDASLPVRVGHSTPSQESDIALEKAPCVWPGWAQGRKPLPVLWWKAMLFEY